MNPITENEYKLSVLECEPVFIPKPWGQEIWYTGEEKRGVSLLKTLDGVSLGPLSTVRPQLGDAYWGKGYSQSPLVLVKILDPFAQEIWGDLYYELHEEKNEVYIVTHLANDQGFIKFSLNYEKLQTEYKGNTDSYQKDFLHAVEAYRNIRLQIEALEDQRRQQEGWKLNEPLPAHISQAWYEELPHALRQKEQQARYQMDSFSGFMPLAVGDVVHVPTHLPHGLQHGVRVVEFQTPTYERLVISSTQKVLTQSHWDSAAGLNKAQWRPPIKNNLILLDSSPEGSVWEQVCHFQEFGAARLSVKGQGLCFKLPAASCYRLAMVLQGTVSQENGRVWKQGPCFTLPAGQNYDLHCEPNTLMLFASPSMEALKICLLN